MLALEEGDGAEEASYAIRSLISSGVLISESTIKDQTTGRLTTMQSRVEGPTAVVFTTTNPEIHPETKSRFFVTSVDESREQTRRILQFQRDKQISDGIMDNVERQAVLSKHHNFQRLLKSLGVKNPYADQLTYGDDRLQGRRDQPKYLRLIKAVAFLRQMQKEVHQERRGDHLVPYVEVELEDMRIANELADDVLGKSLDELSRPGRDLLMLIEEYVTTRVGQLHEEDPDGTYSSANLSFSRRDLREATGWSNYRVHTHLKELVEYEYLAVESGRNGMPYRYRLVYEGQGKDGEKFMLGLRAIEDLVIETAKRMRIAG